MKQLFKLIIVTALFQSCSPGFMLDDSLSLSSSVVDFNFQKGQSLYAEKCASCHNSFSSSTKKQRSEDQLSYAIANQPQMLFLSSLSKDDRLLITYALSEPQGGKTPIYQCKDPLTRGLSSDRIRRLTKNELLNTIQDLLGDTLYNDPTIQLKLNGLPSDQIRSGPGDFIESPSSSLAAVLFDVSLRASELLSASATSRSSVLDPCTASTLTDTCVRTVAQKFGSRVYRRPISTAEADESVAFYKAMGGGAEGLQLLVIRFLQSPSLVFHVEAAGTTVKNGRFRLTDYEVASRISYQTANTMPDSLLMDAASRGDLQNLESVRSHVKRLLTSQKSKEKVGDFFRYYSKLHSEPVLSTKVLNTASIDPTGLGQAMQAETFDFVNYVFWEKEGNFRDLMTSKASFPRTPAMASILGTSIVTPQAPVSEAPNHLGLLHRPALLSNAGERTSPIIRGAHIRMMYLCDELGAVPAEAVAAREAELGDLNAYSNREKTTLLTQSPSCMGCHSQINNLGFPFEGFSPFGGLRQTEPIFAADGTIVRQFPIDPKVTDPRIEAGGPTQFNNSSELVQALALSKKAQACFAKKVFEFYKTKAVQATNDSCLMSETSNDASALSLQTVIVDSIANEDIFWRKDTTAETP